MDQVSEIIRKYRESKGWNKSQLARQLGISSQLLGQYETGKRLPKANFILKWKEVTQQDLLKQDEANVSRETNDPLEKAIENLTHSHREDSDSLKELIYIWKVKHGIIKPELPLFPQPGAPAMETGTKMKRANSDTR